MVVVSLPLTFTNSFWTQDYRRGLEVLYSKLEQGVVENDEIVAFITARANAESQIALALLNPPALSSSGNGFNKDDGASLLMAFRGLQDESAMQGKVHREIATELKNLVAEPFNKWAKEYKQRLSSSKGTALQTWMRAYEDAQKEVIKLKNAYLSKNRRADEAEDEARFALGSDLSDHYTTSPQATPRDARAHLQRSPTVTERISQRFREIQRRATGSPETVGEATDEEKELPKVHKGKGKAVDLPAEETSPLTKSSPLPPTKADSHLPQLPAHPPEIVVAGKSIPLSAVSSLLTRAAAEMPLRPVSFPLLGTYPQCFSGAEFVDWLSKNVPDLEASIDLAEDAARDLTEKEDLLRRIGEFGNEFVYTDDALYQFRPKAFDLEGKSSEAATLRGSQIADNLLKRSNTLVHAVTKALNASSQSEPAHVRLRQEAEEADKLYRVAVRKIDRQRLGVEDRIEEVLKTLQSWEMDRLRAVKTVLLQYQGTLANLPKAFEPTLERSATFIATYQPESDLTALIERYRTGPFRPVPQLYESAAHDESDVVFGIDLRKWAEGGWSALTSGGEKKDIIPPVLVALLDALNDAYHKLDNDAERRRTWIYEVPLRALHHLRESLNAVPPNQPFSQEMLAKYDAAVLAGCVKLWTLELDPPLALWDGWDEFRKLYPTVGAAAKSGEVSEEEHYQNLQAALQRLPKVHLFVLDMIVSHLRRLIEITDTEEDADVYISKLALSIGRTIVRPKVETEMSIQDRHPTLLFNDLLKNYDELLPPAIEKKKRESERQVPVRKRTAPVDMRISRGKFSVGSPNLEVAGITATHSTTGSAREGGAQTPGQATASPIQTTAEDAAALDPSEPEMEPGRAVSPDVPEAAPEDTRMPPRPSFKEPPPEQDDLPPRPTFKEPPPETDDAPHGGYAFASPSAPPPPKAPSPAVAVTPATPVNLMRARKRNSAVLSGSASPARSPSPSPAAAAVPTTLGDDQPLNPVRTSLSRHTSGQGQQVQGGGGVVRGPRLSRVRGSTPGGSVSSMVANLNRVSTSPPPSSGYKRLSGSPRPPVSLGARGPGGFSRRTMASDAEDEVVDK